MKQNKLFLGLGVAVLILVGLTIWILASPGGDVSSESDLITSPTDPTLPGNEGESSDFLASDDPEETYEAYRKWAQYPPYSRPLHAGQVDLLDPYNAERPGLRIVAEPGKGCKPTEDGLNVQCDTPPVFAEVECQMNPERSISVGRTAMRVFLWCASPKSNAKLELSSFESKVYIKNGRKLRNSLPPVSIGDTGKDGDATANDHLYTFVVQPGSQDWGPMYLEVDFKVDGHRHIQRTSWYSTPHVVAEFGQGVQDRKENGSLVVTVPVRVQKAGYYSLDANLQQQGGDQAFVASANWEGRLAVGQQVVRYEFFGKVISDADIDGPYVVREIRGMRDNSPVTADEVRASLDSGKPVQPRNTGEPMMEYMEPYKGTHVTAGYTANEFSKDEWNAPEKTHRLQFLQSRLGN